MSVKSKMNDLLEHLDGQFPNFYIKNGKHLHDAEDHSIEAVVKVCYCIHTGLPFIRATILRTEEVINGEPVDVEHLDDPMEIIKVNEVLQQIADSIL